MTKTKKNTVSFIKIKSSVEGLEEYQKIVTKDKKGELYFPHSILTDKATMTKMAHFDEIEVVVLDGHYYFPLTWIKYNFPKEIKYLNRIEKMIRPLFGKKKGSAA